MVSDVQTNVDLLNAVIQYFGLKSAGKVTLVDNGPVLLTNSKVSVAGVMPILAHLDKLGNKRVLGQSITESSLSRQWIQFKTCLLEANDKKEAITSLLGQVNLCLTTSVYLSGNEVTAADVIMYHAIHGTVKDFSFQEKDRLVNLSRWFQNLQQDPTLRRGKSLVQFSKTMLWN